MQEAANNAQETRVFAHAPLVYEARVRFMGAWKYYIGTTCSPEDREKAHADIRSDKCPDILKARLGKVEYPEGRSVECTLCSKVAADGSPGFGWADEDGAIRRQAQVRELLLAHEADAQYAALAKDSEPFLTAGGSAADLARERGHGPLAAMLGGR